MDTGKETGPSLKRPSQSYVDSYIARRGGAPSPGTAVATSPRGGQARRVARIFYHLDERCPPQYYPKLRVSNEQLTHAVRITLLVFCATQIAFAAAILYMTTNMHDYVEKLFTHGANLLCAFAALTGILGVWLSNRSFLLFFYINQLWGLSNVCTFFVMYYASYQKNHEACIVARNELPAADRDVMLYQNEHLALDCSDIHSTHSAIIGVLLALLTQLWISCFLARTYSEMLADVEDDAGDRELVNFVWERRRETWLQLRRFEDVVQRQFEELRSSLVNRR